MKVSELNDIDPALGLMAEFSKISHGTSEHLGEMRAAVFTDGVLPARIKALAAVLWGVSARCEPCLKFYVRRARELGATDAEVGEMLAIAVAMGGCVGEMWALKAFQAASGQSETEGESCCPA